METTEDVKGFAEEYRKLCNEYGIRIQTAANWTEQGSDLFRDGRLVPTQLGDEFDESLSK